MSKNLYLLVICFFSFFYQINKINGKKLIFIEAKNHESLNSSFLYYLKYLFNIKNFVETGTYLGRTAKIASRIFSKVYSIELDKNLFNQAQELLKDDLNAKLYHGDSKQMLKKIIPELKGRTLFFLDAHWSYGITAKGDENTPILTELKCLQENNLNDCVILIDDIKFFQTKEIIKKQKDLLNDPTIDDYPDINELINQVKKINKDFNFYIYGDMAIIFPNMQNLQVSNLIKAMTASKTSNINNYSEDIQINEKTIQNASSIEKNAIAKLYFQINQSQLKLFNMHYHLWYILTLINNDKEKAILELNEFNKYNEEKAQSIKLSYGL